MTTVYSQVIASSDTGVSDVSAWSTISASPGGTSGQLQYNNSGAFGGISPGATAQAAIQSLLGAPEYYVANYGAKCDGATLSDVTTTSGSGDISSASYTFTAGDIGKYISIAGAGAAGAVLNKTILSVNAGVATLSGTAGTSISGTAVATFGTSDTGSIQSAIDSASASGGGRLVLPFGKCIITASLTWKTNVSLRGQGAGKSILYWLSTGSMTSAVIQGLSGSKTNPYADVTFSDFEIDASAATQASYSVAGKGIYIQYMLRPRFERLYVHDTPATALGVDFLVGGYFAANEIYNSGRLNDGTQAGGSGIGIGTRTDTDNIEDTLVVGNRLRGVKRFGIFFETQVGTLTARAYARVIGNHILLTSGSGDTVSTGIADAGNTGMIIEGNSIYGTSGGGIGIAVNGGTLTTPEGSRGLIANNSMYNVNNGILIDQTGNVSGGTLYTLSNNIISNTYGDCIKVLTHASTALVGLRVNNNFMNVAGSAGAGLYLYGVAGITDLDVRNNLSAGSTNGIKIETPVTRLAMTGNTIRNNSSYAVAFKTYAVTAGQIEDNYFYNNTAGVFTYATGATFSGTIRNNIGYNPVGPSTVSPGASPYTYTAGNTPEVIYIYGGTVSAITKGAITLATATNSSTPMAISLQPGEAIVVTYTVAPTMVADKK